MSEYESVVLVKPEVFVYRIPPLGSSRGYKAADWKLDNPDFVGRLRLVSKSNDLVLKLEDKATGELFAKCPIDKYPGTAVEAVLDSSRYFVVRLVDDSGRTALIGMGFADRGDSFDLNVALQDYFKYLEKDAKLNQELTQEAEKPKLDLSFKEGQTITINLGKKSGTGASRLRTAGTSSPGGFALPPPPPAGSRVAAVSSTGGSAGNSPRGSPGPTAFAQTGRPVTAPPPPSSITTSFQSAAAGARQNLDFFGAGAQMQQQGHQGQPQTATPFFQGQGQSVPLPTNPFLTSSSLFQQNAALTTASNQPAFGGGGGGDSSVGNLLDL